MECFGKSQFRTDGAQAAHAQHEHRALVERCDQLAACNQQAALDLTKRIKAVSWLNQHLSQDPSDAVALLSDLLKRRNVVTLNPSQLANLLIVVAQKAADQAYSEAKGEAIEHPLNIAQMVEDLCGDKPTITKALEQYEALLKPDATGNGDQPPAETARPGSCCGNPDPTHEVCS